MDLLSPEAFRAVRRPLAVLLLGAGPALAPARAQEPSEYQVKGVYLLKFLDYVEGFRIPGAPGGTPFTVGILGEDPFEGLLDQLLQHRAFQGRPMVLRRFKRAEEVRDVQLLYLGPAEPGRWNQALAGLRNQGILTVADGDGQRGAVITFVLRTNKVRFDIDVEAASQAGLKLSSKLLSLAATVKSPGPHGGGR